MKYIEFLLAGILFGVVMVKAEIISWFRIFEMFEFGSFHMFGVIGSAIGVGALGTYMIKRQRWKSIKGDSIHLPDKHKSIPRYLIGGVIFGLGWAAVGACPGPMFVLLGAGYLPILLVILGALFGTFIYGVIRHKLPH